ncbi:MAG: hypothetical protein HKN45_05275 [Flavobacteriales bacterium]|nr:hypothetical protein [Flavobacteriales bacterium]
MLLCFDCKIIIVLFLTLFLGRISAQDEVKKAVQLPEFIISADDSFDSKAFMEHVLSDSSFYQAFINLKYVPHSFDSFLIVRNKGSKEKGNLTRKAIQSLAGNKRVVDITEEESNGKVFKKNGSHRYLTAEMYDEVFFPDEPESVGPTIARFEQIESKESKIDKYKSQLKKMLFNPGQEILSVPFIGDKMDIFSSEMIPYYDYSVYSSYTPDSVYCYVFQVDAKPEFARNKTVIKKMVSYFDKEHLQVVSREYSLSNNTLLFEFDIWMKVENDLVGRDLLPRRVQYNGDWDIPFRSAEIIQFDIRCRDYDTSVLR